MSVVSQSANRVNHWLMSNQFYSQYSEYQRYVNEYKQIMNIENLLSMIYNLELSILTLRQPEFRSDINRLKPWPLSEPKDPNEVSINEQLNQNPQTQSQNDPIENPIIQTHPLNPPPQALNFL